MRKDKIGDDKVADRNQQKRNDESDVDDDREREEQNFVDVENPEGKRQPGYLPAEIVFRVHKNRHDQRKRRADAAGNDKVEQKDLRGYSGEYIEVQVGGIGKNSIDMGAVNTRCPPDAMNGNNLYQCLQGNGKRIDEGSEKMRQVCKNIFADIGEDLNKDKINDKNRENGVDDDGKLFVDDITFYNFYALNLVDIKV